jgi:hypothetical protein
MDVIMVDMVDITVDMTVDMVDTDIITDRY